MFFVWNLSAMRGHQESMSRGFMFDLDGVQRLFEDGLETL
jgi:hypothetical protein